MNDNTVKLDQDNFQEEILERRQGGSDRGPSKGVVQKKLEELSR